MIHFVNFESAEDNVNDFIDEEGEKVYENVSNHDFINDENDFDEIVEGCYAFINVSRSVEDATQDSFIDYDYSWEVNNYCLDD